MELFKWIEATNHYMDTFEFKYGVTPFSEWQWPVYASVLYLITIFGLKYGLPFQLTLKYPQALHNLILSVGSFIVLSGLLFDLAMAMLTENATPNDLFCDPNGRYYKGRVAFWVWIFHLSKFYEFIDTVFIALKKKPLDFLHVYHHILTLFATWLGLVTNTTFQWIGVVTNTLVHTVMYYYYLRTTLDPEVRIWWKKHLTQMQITQFYFNLAVLALWLVVNYTVQPCSGSVSIVWVTIFANATFNLLFNRFFSRTYTKKDGKGEAANGASKIKKDK